MVYIEGIHGTMSELMKRQKSLMLKHHNIIYHEFLQLNVIHQSHSPQDCQSNLFYLKLQIIYVYKYKILLKKLCKFHVNKSCIKSGQYYFLFQFRASKIIIQTQKQT